MPCAAMAAAAALAAANLTVGTPNTFALFLLFYDIPNSGADDNCHNRNNNSIRHSFTLTKLCILTWS